MKRKIKSQTWKDTQRYKQNLRKRPPRLTNQHNFRSRPISRKRGRRDERGILAILFWKLFKFCLFLGLIAALVVFLYIAKISRDLPDPNKLTEREVAQSTRIYDRSGETILYEIYGEEKRTIIDLGELPDYVKQATIAIEDKDFYTHKGISIFGIIRGVIWQSVRGKRMQGGSTLTQQFIKNSILTDERTVTRKIKEWILSYRLEQKFSKDEILQMYFNEIPYGSTAYGVEAASQRYFGKSARDLHLAEAAILAALPQAPSRYSPFGSNRDTLIGRQHYILDLMVEQGYIPYPKAEAAKQYELEFKEQSNNIIAPHFVMYVKEILGEKYGEKMIEQEGLQIYTTLDLEKQKLAEEIIMEIGEKNAEEYGASNAALLALDPKTGEIVSMVGSRDYFNDEIDGQFNITTSIRQPGSSMKPLVYAAAFNQGYTPDTILYDVVTNFSNVDGESYEPHNYDSEEHGPVTIRKALAGSLNIPAVKAMYLAGIDNVLNLARDLGYTTLEDKDRFGLSLVLGGGEVKMIEHVNAYSAFAREGKINSLKAILEIRDKNGKILEKFEGEESRQVLDPKVARAINDILSDNNARTYAFGANNWLHFANRPVAAKTGTTNDYRDAWTIGYTPSIVVGVWVGNNDNSPMKRGAAGGKVAAPIWHKFMAEATKSHPVERFRKFEREETGKDVLDGKSATSSIVKIDKISGLLATEHTPEEAIEEKEFIQAHSILYYLDKNDPRGEKPEEASRDPQFQLWEDAILGWLESEAASSTDLSIEMPPIESDNIHTADAKPSLRILSPANNETITQPFLNSRVEIDAKRNVQFVSYYIDNNLFKIQVNYPYSLEEEIDFLDNGFHNLSVKVCDDVMNCARESVEFNLNISNNRVKEYNTQVNFVEPSDGLAMTSVDFPLRMVVRNTNQRQTAKINVYMANTIDNDPVLIGAIEPINSDMLEFFWHNAPDSGTYSVFTEAYSWGGQIEKGGKINIIVDN